MKLLKISIVALAALAMSCDNDDDYANDGMMILPDGVGTISLSDFTAASIDENTPAGTAAGSVDAEFTGGTSELVTYSVSNVLPTGAISVDNNGNLTVDQVINFEENDQITFTATATTPNQAASRDLSIDVNNLRNAAEDRKALERIYNDNPGALSWDLTDPTINNWDGVLRGLGDRVVSLTVQNEALFTTIDTQDLDNLDGLDVLTITNCQLTSVDVPNMPALRLVQLFGNELTNFTLAPIPSVRQVLLESNQLTTADLSGLSGVTDIKAQFNQLTSFNIRNGNNSNLTRLEIPGNANLTCITVDDAALDPNFDFTGWQVSTGVSLSAACQ